MWPWLSLSGLQVFKISFTVVSVILLQCERHQKTMWTGRAGAVHLGPTCFDQNEISHDGVNFTKAWNPKPITDDAIYISQHGESFVWKQGTGQGHTSTDQTTLASLQPRMSHYYLAAFTVWNPFQSQNEQHEDELQHWPMMVSERKT